MMLFFCKSLNSFKIEIFVKASKKFDKNNLAKIVLWFAKTTRLSELLFFAVFVTAGLLN